MGRPSRSAPTAMHRGIDNAPVDLALARFRRPPVSALPVGLRRDIRAFFGTYAAGCRRVEVPRGGAPG